MAIAKTKKIQLIAHKRHQKNILEALQETEMVQIAEKNSDPIINQQLSQDTSAIDYQLAGIIFALQFLSQFETQKKPLTQSFQPDIKLSNSALVSAIKSFDHQEIVKKVQDCESQINQSTSLIEKLTSEQNQLSPWVDLDFVPKKQTTTSGFTYMLVSGAQQSIALFEKALKEKSPLSTFDLISDQKTESKAVIWYQANQESSINNLLEEFGVSRQDLPTLEVKINDRLKQINQELQTAEKNITSANQSAKQLTSHLPNLMIAHDHLTWEKERLTQLQKATSTHQTFSLIFWVAEKNFSTVEKSLEKVTNEILIEELSITDEDSIPIIFENGWAKPFETVTGIYGAPQHNEPDPTPFLAPFFTLFFGFAITDAGYGIILALATYGAIKIFKIPKKSQKMLWVLFWGGISSFILGALMGGWFSVDLATLPPVIGNILIAIRLINPIEDPVSIFYLSLALGVIQVIFGLGVNLWWNIKQGRIKQGVLGSGLWILTIVSLLLFAASSMGFLSADLISVFKWLTIFGLAGLVIARALESKNFIMGLPMGILSLYGFVGYFSDVLSYSRLLALGLTTGIIGMVVNLIAGIVLPVPFIGWLLALIILVGGHLFNLGINALGAFIHSGRLQYIEFFPKFMEGGGFSFQPFKRESRYIEVIKNN
jgi:V/A-type H+-transporting ATPase subunit I